MRDFEIDDIIEEISKDYPDIEKKVLKKICKESLLNMIKIIKKGKDQIMLKHADIHSVYQEIDVKPVFADLDETKFLTGIDEQIAKNQEREAKGIFAARLRSGSKVKRIYNTRPPAYPVYARPDTERSSGEVCGPIHSGEEIQSNSAALGE